MNGDLGKIYNLVLEVKEQVNKNTLIQVANTAKQDARHEENMRINEDRKKEINLLFERDRKRPCKTHAERMKWMHLWIGLVGSGFLYLVWILRDHIWKGNI